MNDNLMWALMLELPDGTYVTTAVFKTWRAATQAAVARGQQTGPGEWHVKAIRAQGPYRVPPLVQLAECAE